jgi:hypothetical protein
MLALRRARKAMVGAGRVSPCVDARTDAHDLEEACDDEKDSRHGENS